MVFLPDVPSVILNVPIVISLIAVIRYMVGFKTWKNYPVLALTLAFYFFYQLLESVGLTLLLWVGFSLIVIGSALGVRYLIRKLKINYYSRVAAMYMGATFASIFAMFLLSYTIYGSLVSDMYFGLGVFLIATTIDDLATLLFKKDSQEFIRRTVTTFGVALLTGLLVCWAWWNRVLGNHQEILFLVLLVDAITAFWTSVRLTEYLRFGSILKNQK